MCVSQLSITRVRCSSLSVERNTRSSLVGCFYTLCPFVLSGSFSLILSLSLSLCRSFVALSLSTSLHCVSHLSWCLSLVVGVTLIKRVDLSTQTQSKTEEKSTEKKTKGKGKRKRGEEEKETEGPKDYVMDCFHVVKHKHVFPSLFFDHHSR